MILILLVLCLGISANYLNHGPPGSNPLGFYKKEISYPKAEYKDGSEAVYTVEGGYLAAGDDVQSGNHTVTEAESICDSLGSECAGFTFEDTDKAPTTPVNCYFKSVINFVTSTGWWSYVKGSTPPPPPDTNFSVGGLNVLLRANSHSIEKLMLTNDLMPPYNFSFVPPLTGYERPDRSGQKCHQLGDITIRFQPQSVTNGTSYALYSSSWAGGVVSAIPLTDLPAGVVAGDDITPLLNATAASSRIVNYPLTLTVKRTYEIFTDSQGSKSLVMRFNLTATDNIRLGGFGISLPADDNTNNLQLNQIAYINSFIDPHIGNEHAFAEWTRVIGNTTMVVLPHTLNTKMEAWRPLMEDCRFNGALAEWTVLSGAWANEWDNQQQAPIFTMPSDLANTGVWPNPQSPWPEWHLSETLKLTGMRNRYWNTPSVLELSTGQTVSYALRFVLTPNGPRTRDSTIAQSGYPTLRPVPGYVISTDMSSASLFVSVPSNLKPVSVSITPTGILQAGSLSSVTTNTSKVPLKGLATGRARLAILLSDNTEVIAHYYVLPSFPTQISNLGTHWQNVAWLPENYADPFGRGASVMPWDREDKLHVLQDSRAYIVGLSDDAGAASNLGNAMKVNWAPVQEQVTRVDDYIKYTLYGVKSGVASAPLRSLQGRPEDGATYQDKIRMTLFYYCSTPGTCKAAPEWPYNYTEQNKCSMPVNGPIWCMPESYADQTYRSYNYPHQIATYWAMYRIARNFNFTTYQTWNWYLERAYRTTRVVGTPDVGLMDGTVFREVLLALIAEGASNTTIQGWANDVSNQMKVRAQNWNTQTFPYGSEFNWDTTGQEEVYIWLTYFNYTASAQRTLQSVLGYMHKFPNWAWNGGARSMGDLGNNGKWFINRGTERILQHYRAGLNMIPLIEAYRANPDDLLLLEIAMGAITGQLTNINANGETSMGFHSYPFVLEHDPYSGDYGLGFFGHTLETGAYIVLDTSLDWLCYLCDITASTPAKTVSYTVRDSYRVRSYVEPVGLYLVAQTATLDSLSLDLTARTLQITFAGVSSGSRPYSKIRLELHKQGTTRPGTNFRAVCGTATCPIVRGAYEITPATQASDPTTVSVAWDQ